MKIVYYFEIKLVVKKSYNSKKLTVIFQAKR